MDAKEAQARRGHKLPIRSHPYRMPCLCHTNPRVFVGSKLVAIKLSMRPGVTCGGGVPPPYLVYLPFFPTTLFSLFALFLSLSFLLNNSPNLDPGSHSSRLFSFPPDYGSCLGRHFYRERTSALVDSHPFAFNQHMCIRTLGAFFGCFVWQRTWMSTWRPATRRSSTTCTRLCPRRKKTSKTSR